MKEINNMEKILITGGAGYIGSMLSTKLVELGYKVTVLDLLKYDKNSLSHLYFHKNFEFIRGDANKKSLIKKIIKGFDIIIPLSALVGAPLCAKNKKTIKANVTSIEIILKYINKNKN